MTMRFTFPGGKKKALTFSYDDNQIFDRRLVEILNRYQMKGTFHINSGKLGMAAGRDVFVSEEELKELYEGHEIAGHGTQHRYLRELNAEELVREVLWDREKLEQLTGRIVTGYSYAFGQYSGRICEALKNFGIDYARTVESTGNFLLPEDFYAWNPTCHHNQAADCLESFLNPPEYRSLILFYVWGHSYEFDRDDSWDRFERFARNVSGRADVWYAANIEICRYIKAMRGMISSVDGQVLYNPSAVTVWGLCGDELIKIAPGETYRAAEGVSCNEGADI